MTNNGPTRVEVPDDDRLPDLRAETGASWRDLIAACVTVGLDHPNDVKQRLKGRPTRRSGPKSVTLTIDCPTCEALAGQKCVGTRGQTRQSHPQRVTKAKEPTMAKRKNREDAAPGKTIHWQYLGPDDKWRKATIKELSNYQGDQSVLCEPSTFDRIVQKHTDSGHIPLEGKEEPYDWYIS